MSYYKADIQDQLRMQDNNIHQYTMKSWMISDLNFYLLGKDYGITWAVVQ